MRETTRARKAWLAYLAMGTDRSLDKLALQLRDTTRGYGKSTAKTTSRLLARWSAAHHWQARLAQAAEEEREAIIRRGIAEKQNRLDDYNDRWQRMKRVIAERAADPSMANVPGGQTGLLVRIVIPLRHGGYFERYEVDCGLLREMRELEKQAAIEVGDWVERGELSGKHGGPIVANVIDFVDARLELELRLAQISARNAGGA